MKKVLLLGATGTAGSAPAKKLLSDTDCHITLFSRHAETVYSNTMRTKAVNGDAISIDDLKTVMNGLDVVYFARFPEAVCRRLQKTSSEQGTKTV